MSVQASPTRGPLAGSGAVFWREMLLLRKRSRRYVASMAVSPLLYMTAFAYAVGRGVEVDGRPYAAFLIPGLAAMSAMMQSFSIGSEINVARFYWKVFEEFQCAPMTDLAYALGEVAAGAVRGLLAVLVIILVGLPFGIVLHYGPWFWLAAALNSIAFSSLGTGLAMIVRGHQDQMLLQTFVITPMAFLGGTFFPVDRLPSWLGTIIDLLPLTHAARAMREAAFGQTPPAMSMAVLGASALIFFMLAHRVVRKARD